MYLNINTKARYAEKRKLDCCILTILCVLIFSSNAYSCGVERNGSDICPAIAEAWAYCTLLANDSTRKPLGYVCMLGDRNRVLVTLNDPFKDDEVGGEISYLSNCSSGEFNIVTGRCPPLPIIILDPGHGLLLGDDGRKHYQRPESPTFGLREDNLTLAMATAAKQQLTNDGYKVIMTRNGADAPFAASCGKPDLVTDRIDYCNRDLQARMDIVRETKEDIGVTTGIVFVSIHTNGGSIMRFVKGRTQTFYCFNPAATLSDGLHHEMATIAPPNFSLLRGGYNACGIVHRITGGKKYGVIDRTTKMNIPGSLIEVLYHSDVDDEALLNSPAFLTHAGGGIAKAIKNFTEQ